MEPSPAEAAAFTDVNSVADWASLAHRPAGGGHIDSPRGTLFAVLGVTGGEPYRVLAGIPGPDWTALLQAWQVAQSPPTPAARSQGGLLGLAARVASGAQERLEVLRKRQEDQLTLQLLTAQATGTAAAAASAAPLPPPGKKVKLSTVADQANDMEVGELTPAQIKAAYDKFENTMGGLPAPHEELTGEQLAALHALLQGSGPPYVDFSVWGPFGHRISKRVKLSALMRGPSGQLQPVELFGPPDFDSWEACFRVWRTGCLMLGAMTCAALDSYRDLMHLYHRRYGGASWGILYQADVRARLEQIDRVRRRGIAEHATAIAAGAAHAYDPGRPWEWCLRQLVDDHGFWRRELEEPAMLVLAKSAKLNSMVDGDAMVSNLASATASSSHLPAPPAPPGRRADPKAKARGPKHHSVGEDGSLATNRSGTRLCNDFQAGQCSESLVRGRCPRDARLAHQCAKCLSPAHGASQCRDEAARPPARKGKGKGKKGGGRRPQY